MIFMRLTTVRDRFLLPRFKDTVQIILSAQQQECTFGICGADIYTLLDKLCNKLVKFIVRHKTPGLSTTRHVYANIYTEESIGELPD